ncbi:MAG: peptide-modifying radical SAM enzyme CbpB [Candidatus Omnitrophota bacterium]
MLKSKILNNYVSSRGRHFNSGAAIQIQPVDIGHKDYICLVSAETAFWVLIRKDKLFWALTNPSFLQGYRKKEKFFIDEINSLRFGLRPSAVYFNPTDRCNLNCAYCYIPERLRKNGKHMSFQRLSRALEILKIYFKSTLPKGQKAQIIFHGAEPLLNKKAILQAIDKFVDDFHFGIQTNGTLLDNKTIDYFMSRQISIGLSLDGHIAEVADRVRRTWGGRGSFQNVAGVITYLRGYKNYSVICTVTKTNMSSLPRIIEFMHRMDVPVCMLNPVRCTLPASRRYKPADHLLVKHYLKALDYTYELYRKTGRKIIVANFANILMGIIAPSARRLMCDISPCGGGRCFFAISSRGDLFPCSEFIGLKKFKGGNIFKNNIKKVLETKQFKLVTERKIENIESCFRCAIRHFCGAPCPAEVHEMYKSMEQPGAFCELYEEQVRYAFRIIADDKENAYLWDDWDKGISTSLEINSF